MGDIGYSIEPRKVKLVETKFRKICTQIPVPESTPILKQLRSTEARSLHWQAPVFWDKAENYNVYDKYGNKWLDMSSGIAVANVGHARKEVVDAIVEQARHGLLYGFTFPTEVKTRFLEKLFEVVPKYLQKAFLMSAGSEACENALKLCRKFAHVTKGKEKNVVVSFEYAFHGRTLGSQMMGGLPGLKDWIINHDPDIVQVPHPNGFYNEDVSFELFEKTLEQKGIKPERVAGIMLESFQGTTSFGVPKKYAQELSKWTKDHGALMIYDEVQAGFGRTGRLFGYMHYDVVPDIVCLGKAITGCIPISATIARGEIMDVFPPGEMTSTHTGNPLGCAAGIANLDLLVKEKLVERSANLGETFKKQIDNIVDKHPIAGYGAAHGLFGGIHIVTPKTKTPRKDLAYKVNQKLYEKGIMIFAPVGPATVKLAPPLIIPEDALLEATAVIDEAIGEVEKEENLA